MNICVRKLYAVRLRVKQITVTTTSHWYSLQERVFSLRASSKYELIFKEYRKRFPNSPIPKCETVYPVVKCFEKIGSVKDIKHIDCLCSVCTKENVQQVSQPFIETPARSQPLIETPAQSLQKVSREQVLN